MLLIFGLTFEPDDENSSYDHLLTFLILKNSRICLELFVLTFEALAAKIHEMTIRVDA